MATEVINGDNKFLNLTQLGNYTKKVTTLIDKAKNEGSNAALKAASAATAAANAQDAAEAADNKAQTALDTADAAMPKSGGSFTGAIKWQTGSSPNVEISYDGITATVIKKSGGTASQVLMADGSVKKVVSGSNKIDENATANKDCIPLLDDTGRIPLSMLGNLDTTVAEVVTSLPMANIKKHIYMVASSSTTSQNVYKEYIYTGDPASTYDASKWEQLGEYKASIDLSDYLTESEASDNYQFKIDTVIFDESATTSGNLRITLHNGRPNTPAGGGYGIVGEVPNATTSLAGLMSKADKAKLDGISTGANKITIDSTLSSSSTNPVQNKVVYTALLSKASTSVATTTANGLMSSSDKTKLNGIAAGANNYVLPTASTSVKGGVYLGNSFYTDEDHLELNAITEDEINALF